MELKLNHIYLINTLNYESANLVGKICKRFEIITNNNDLLKSEVKELIYEEFRSLRDLLIAGGKGLEQRIWKFNNKRV